jgi:hypothetical protein
LCYLILQKIRKNNFCGYLTISLHNAKIFGVLKIRKTRIYHAFQTTKENGMKIKRGNFITIIAVLIVIFAVFRLINSELSKSNDSIHKYKVADRIIRETFYMKDYRTGLCFVCSNPDRSIISEVPCESVPDSLLIVVNGENK